MSPTSDLHFQVHDQRFATIIGETPIIELVAENLDYPFAHEAGVFFPGTHTLFCTSNRCVGSDGQQKVHITRVDLSETPAMCEDIRADIPMANGGINYGKDHILFCAQGSMTERSGFYCMSITAPYRTELLKGDFFGRPFNSVNDVVVHSDGSIWFTDPIYGAEQGYRPQPCLPNQVYRWCPDTGSIRAMADGLGKPNGICFSPDERVVYITDTDRVQGDGTVYDHRVSSIYAFDVSTYYGEPFLTNRRLFAMADQGSQTALNVTEGGMCTVAMGTGFMCGPRGGFSWAGF
ncbi:hypothetical protein ABOM_000019 [Aspergillus bombycis]|uniref:SMP-30/Gluconolactonase/LRE-like region domain-containing protein n=1 Tax=Aspergillus bombycis TaxID=109264 RepID=A0A1F8AH11_9EURO|nr:hypothetical protein ABOM_000019 [Aspergillus bombycis]OGM51033.1 hypothetical protein ABOM_000019 [Aspergillus bombycis]